MINMMPLNEFLELLDAFILDINKHGKINFNNMVSITVNGKIGKGLEISIGEHKETGSFALMLDIKTND
jgi:hypothetical protein